MRWRNFSENREREAAGLVVDTVDFFRGRGHGGQLAIREAAFALDIPARTARSLLYGEAVSVSIEKYRALRRRFLDHLDARTRDFEARAEAARTRRRQMELEL